MNLLPRPVCFLALALAALPASALSQQEMLQQYKAAAKPIPQRYHSEFRAGMLLHAEFVPSADSGRPFSLALTPQGCRLDDGLPADTPVRPSDDFILRVRCVAADGSRMGFIQLEVKADGCVKRVVRSSQPGEYRRERPFVFRHRESASTLTWRFSDGVFQGLSIEYSVGTHAGTEYGPDGEVKTISIIPSRQWPPPMPALTPPSVEMEEGAFDPAPPVIDLSEVEGELGAEGAASGGEQG